MVFRGLGAQKNVAPNLARKYFLNWNHSLSLCSAFSGKKKTISQSQPELALKSIPHPGIFGGFGRNVFFLQYGDFIKKPEVLILLSKTTT